VNAEDLLRRYLEQRREMGERELVLDDLTVEEVMRILGAGKRRGVTVEREHPRARAVDERKASPRSHEVPDDIAGDWRAALRSAEVAAAPAAKPESPARAFPPPPDVESAAESTAAKPPIPAPGPAIVVGSAGTELFGGPFSNLASLEELASAVAGCSRCSLYETASRAVPGEGNAKAELVCVGEAPGANEDATGRPFVGQAGQLLTKILGAINLQREDVFICNVLKHRPPGNRNPFPTEVEACSPYLIRQLELIRPKAILALGTFAAQTLLNTKLPIGKLRGATHRYHGIPLVVTYHPAALLRNPAWKRPTWEDVQHVRRILDSAPSAP
jgi:DNA polymerase